MKNAFLTVVTKQGLEELRMMENVFARHLKPFEGEKAPGILKVSRYAKPDRWEIVPPNHSESPGHILPEIIINPSITSYYTINPEEYLNSLGYEKCKGVGPHIRSALGMTVKELLNAGLGDIVQYSEGFGNAFWNRHMLLETRHVMIVEGVKAGILWGAEFSRLGVELSLEGLTERIEGMVQKTQEEQLSKLPDVNVTHFKDRSEMSLSAEVKSLIEQIDSKRGGLVECHEIVEKLGGMGVDFVPTFIELLRDKSEYIRFYMITILRDMGDERAIDEIRWLSENEPVNFVRLSAQCVLEKMETKPSSESSD